MMAFVWGFLGVAGVMLAIWLVALGLSAWRKSRHKREWPATRLREMKVFAPGDRRTQDLPFVGADRREASDLLAAAFGAPQRGTPVDVDTEAETETDAPRRLRA